MLRKLIKTVSEHEQAYNKTFVDKLLEISEDK